MSMSVQVGDLLLAWEEARDEGRAVSPEQLCRDRPDLLPELKKQIAALEQINPWLHPQRRPHTIAFGPDIGLHAEIRGLLHTRLRIAGSILLASTLVFLVVSLVDPLDRHL